MPRRSRLLAGCALGAALASPAAAQSYNGTSSVVAGTAVVTTGPGTTSILVLEAETVINWTAVDTFATGAIDFQPDGTQAFFQSDPGLPDYTVLNRILPVNSSLAPTAATVTFNGITTALLGNGPGGNIWFYSPTGIIAGPTASFNVGSLILTTNNIPFTVGGPNALYGPGGLVQLQGPAGSTGFVEIDPGAQINATGANAYVALVAPRVVQGGLVQANGQIAYLAAEQVDMTINGGLFDFVITVGTTDLEGIVHEATGTTTGPASISAADLQRISMVALPKNNAMTMMLSGSVGYTPAASAANEGSAVILAAGFATEDPTNFPAVELGNVGIGNATLRNRLTAYASDNLTIAPTGGNAVFQADASLFARNSIALAAEAGEQVTAAGDLRLHAGEPGAGGTIDIRALGSGLIGVAGTLEADASSAAAQFVAAPAFLDAAGGNVDVLADGGTINALNLVVGAGAFANFGDARGGIGTAGTVDVAIANGGTMTLDSLNLNAGALGGASTRDGGDGVGGAASLTLGAGTLTAGTVLIEANGEGGASEASTLATPYQAGQGLGGTSQLTLNGGAATVTTLELQSNGFGASNEAAATGSDLTAIAGDGTGGNALLRLDAGSLTTTSATIAALGTGGDGMGHAGAGAASQGGDGTGGTAVLQSSAGGTASFTTTTLLVQANGQGGEGGDSVSGLDGSGGFGAGFSAAADLADGEFSLGAVTIEATGAGGDRGDAGSGVAGAEGGYGFGGMARFALVDSAAGPSGARSLDSLAIDASGFGGLGSAFAAQSATGEADLTVSALDPVSALVLPGSLTIFAGGLDQTATGGIEALISGAPLQVGGDIVMSSEGPLTVTAGQPLLANTSVTLNGLSVTTTGLVQSGAEMSVTGLAGITAEQLTSADTTSLNASLGPIVVGDLLSAGAVTARGRSVAIASTGGLDFFEATATAGDVTILTDDFLNTQTVNATNLADLRTDGTLHATGDVAAGTIDLRANADILADAGLLATVNLSASARGTFTLAGSARGTSITVASGNIALGAGASLGSRGATDDLTLTNLNVAAVMNIGGEAQAGYSLDQAEAARLFADDSISFGIAALPLEPGYGRIAVGDLTLTFGATGNIGSGGQLEISTPAQIAITGDVALTTSGPDDTFLIDPALIELDSSTGSIALLDAGGNPVGRLEMVGDTIAIASTPALTQLRTLTDMAAINALLDTPGGAGLPLRAGTVVLTADDGLFVQNSGATAAFADRRGFAAGGLDINTGSPATRIVVNGQILTAGGPASGLATAPLIRINGAAPAAGGQFDARSTINGCVIGGNCAIPSEILEFSPPTSEDIESPIPSGEGEGSLFVAPLIELAGTEPLITPPLVDEPITGVGNDDLWEPRCTPGDEGGACSEDDPQP